MFFGVRHRDRSPSPSAELSTASLPSTMLLRSSRYAQATRAIPNVGPKEPLSRMKFMRCEVRVPPSETREGGARRQIYPPLSARGPRSTATRGSRATPSALYVFPFRRRAVAVCGAWPRRGAFSRWRGSRCSSRCQRVKLARCVHSAQVTVIPFVRLLVAGRRQRGDHNEGQSFRPGRATRILDHVTPCVNRVRELTSHHGVQPIVRPFDVFSVAGVQ